MAMFEEKAKTWKRIMTAEALAARMDNVQVRLRDEYEYIANPPCHASRSGESLHFGNVGIGSGLSAIRISCWHCCKGRGGWAGMMDRIEDHLGMAVHALRPDGELRYRWGAPGPVSDSLGTVPRASSKPRDTHGAGVMDRIEDHLGMAVHALRPDGELRYRWGAPGPVSDSLGTVPRASSRPRDTHGTECPPGFTLGDLLAQPVFFSGRGKASFQRFQDGYHRGFRHSLKDADGGLQVARFGGWGWWTKPDTKERVRIQVWPWLPWDDLMERIEARHEPDLLPCMALGGEAEVPSPLDIVVIDFDFHPELDKEGAGQRLRDALRAAFVEAGCPVCVSTSGNGFHALGRMAPKWLEANRNVRQGEDRYPAARSLTHGGAVVEIFPAGVKRHMVVRLERAVANAGREVVLPVFTRVWLDDLIHREARGSFRKGST